MNDENNHLQSWIGGANRYIWLGVTAIGSVAGFFLNLYTDEVRELLEKFWPQIPIQWLLYSAILLASCYSTWRLSFWATVRRLDRQQVVEKDIQIRSDSFADDLPADQLVIGRRLRYLERVTDSHVLVVCLHGLGLDANDFRPYMQMAREHTAAITLFGFNEDEAKDVHYQPLAFDTHAQLVSIAIANLQKQNPRKKLVIVGFSLGADMQLKLGELWREDRDRCPRVSAMLLLDPNINHSTMTVSRGVAELDASDPLVALKKIAQIPRDVIEFQNICEYLHKISSKDLLRARRHAKDIFDYWEPAGSYQLFLERISNLRSVCGRLKVVFSTHYDSRVNDIINAGRQRIGRDISVEPMDHFALLQDRFLASQVASVIDSRQ